MIKVTRLNDTQLVINADLIEFVESIPDTIIMVKETIDEVIERVARFKRISGARLTQAGAGALSEGN